MVKVSPAYLAQVHCNRTEGHPGKHRRYDPKTFAIIAEWTEAYDADMPRQKIETVNKR
jgi:hypothetical protein